MSATSRKVTFCAKTNKHRAFTLVELLVVIAIIGLLSTVAIVSLDSARVKSRIAKRNSDTEQIYKAFTLAYNAGGGSFPTSGGACVSTACGGGWAGVGASAAVDAYLSPYMASKTTDPLDGKRTVTGYVYTTSFSGTGPYDGFVFPAAPYLSWFNETPSNLASVCGPGHIYTSNSTQTQCFLQLDQ
jgi:prepilin-type N-terminal cleavage/methylation domain-containing protein